MLDGVFQGRQRVRCAGAHLSLQRDRLVVVSHRRLGRPAGVGQLPIDVGERIAERRECARDGPPARLHVKSGCINCSPEGSDLYSVDGKVVFATFGSNLVTDYVRSLRALVGSEPLLQLPAVCIAIRDTEGRVLMAHHVETNRWGLPGGTIEPGETPADAAVREAWEETGLVVRLTRLVGVFSGPQHVVQYRNGDRASYVSSAFEAAIEHGTVQPDASELRELRFVSHAEASALSLSAWLPEILAAVFSGQQGTFRPSVWNPPSD